MSINNFFLEIKMNSFKIYKGNNTRRNCEFKTVYYYLNIYLYKFSFSSLK